MLEKFMYRTRLVVQWIRNLLPVQGTHVPSLGRFCVLWSN